MFFIYELMSVDVPEGRYDRSLARSAWDSVTPKSRPVGYGVISMGVRTESIGCGRGAKTLQIYVVLFRPNDTILSMATWHLAGTLHYIGQQLEHHRTRTFQEEYLAFLKKTRRTFRRKILWD
jgi:hypothetical protein